MDFKLDLLTLAKNCDLEGVKKFLKEHTEFDINSKDHRGVTALHLAVKFNCGPIVRFLLSQPNIKIGDAALLAIAENNLELAILLLDRIKTINVEAEYKGVEGSSAYPPYMTPLMLASLYGHYNMIKILIKRNHRLEKPHDTSCDCNTCHYTAQEDQLEIVDKRIAVFKSICNPAFISLTSKDPILTALRLFKDLKNWSKSDSASAKEYNIIGDNVARFSTELMDETNNTQEVDTILKRKEGWVYSGKTLYPRLTMAMIYQNKDFVGNIHVQQVLENTWYGKYSWKKCTIFGKFLKICKRILCIPIVAILSIIQPNNEWVMNQLKTPVIMFIDRTIMFTIFLFIIFWENNADKKQSDRGFPSTGAEPFFILFTFGFLWRTLRLAMLQGIARYFRFVWNIWDFIMQIFLAITITCWVIAFLRYGVDQNERNVPRKEWNAFEPILIAESALVFATFMAFTKILFLFQLHPVLGPLQMSLSSMLKDCFKFMIIIAIFMLSFGAGLNNLYSYYDGMKYKNPATEEEYKQEFSFMNFGATIATLYFSIFGLSDKNSGVVVLDNGNHHILTEATGYLMFLVFGFTMIIIVINMLIASLSNIYQRVIDNNMDEWAYGKTEVFLAHMDGLLILPVPFNFLLEWINDVRYLIRNLRDKRKKWQCTLWHGCFMTEVEPKEEETEYVALMAQLRSRYFLKNCKLFRLGAPEISDDFCADDDD